MAKRKKAPSPDPTLADRRSLDGRRPIAKLRHWKQQFEENAKMVWRRNVHWDSETNFKTGDAVPEGLISRVKLHRFWESGWIEILEFEAPNVATGRVDEAPETVEKLSADETTLAAGETAGDAGESRESDESPEGVVSPPGSDEAGESDESAAQNEGA